jgi:hypothetical protein
MPPLYKSKGWNVTIQKDGVMDGIKKSPAFAELSAK